MPNPDYTAYEPAAPYFDLVRGALGDLVDGEHFFDVITEDTIYEVRYDFPGWPRIITGRADLMAMFRGYVDNIALQSADHLIAHKADGTVVIEYEVHGTILATGVAYNNQFCSIIRIENRKIAQWGLHGLSRPSTRIWARRFRRWDGWKRRGHVTNERSQSSRIWPRRR